ncbi:hypothetical protein [Cesiribacter andamanensis]|uniref:Uncharacterized protein n=1 Tax=Cesiribacter andamanensis AMV16 TaxID=1279009 RepID=M7N4P6_9BACT|nr:hypothetical protein [Cesiribacter andamanensis]EMR02201.1 hypothetical protein ADICEAN_02676 [Cesiribacter andamanensis AMV16]
MIRTKLSGPLHIVSLILLVWLSGCEKVENLLRFTFNDSVEITIPSQSLISNVPIKIASPEVQTSSQQAFANNNTQAKYVKEAKLKSLELTISSPQDQTFSFLNEIKIYISASGQPELLLASKENIPASAGRQLSLDVSQANLKPYIQGDAYTIRTEAVIDEVLTREVKITADLAFAVTADVF